QCGHTANESLVSNLQPGQGMSAIDASAQPKFSLSPGRGHFIDASFPVPESVMYAVVRSRPPKQMFVVSGSDIGTCSTFAPSGETTVIAPFASVATQTFPAESTASESNSWNPGRPSSK